MDNGTFLQKEICTFLLNRAVFSVMSYSTNGCISLRRSVLFNGKGIGVKHKIKKPE